MQADVPPDVHDAVLTFWAALGATTRDAEVAFWSAAFDTGSQVSADRDEYVLLDRVTAVGGPVAFEVQHVADRPRFHLDLAAADVAAEATRLEALGAPR